MTEVTLIRGDATERWPLPDNSLDSIVTDPPYGIAFMGKEWDDKGGPQAYQEWTARWASEAFRCLKPGGFLLAFGSPRMVHRMACGFEDAGFRIVDTIEWLYLTGFPKAQDIGKMFDKRQRGEFIKREAPQAFLDRLPSNTRWDWIHGGHVPGEAWWKRILAELENAKDVEPEVVAYVRKAAGWFTSRDEYAVTEPKSPLAKQWVGWKTPNLKPAHEPIVMAQKPFPGTYIDNIERWGVGAINVDGCRIPTDDDLNGGAYSKNKKDDGKWGTLHRYVGKDFEQPAGRFPANVVTLDEDQWYSPYFNITPRELSKKASPAERKGDGWRNNHPTVKPVELVRWLQRLVTPPGGTTASPFLGSGTDAVAAIFEGFNFWGMELSDEYWPLIEARVDEAKRKVEQEKASRPAVVQGRLF